MYSNDAKDAFIDVGGGQETSFKFAKRKRDLYHESCKSGIHYSDNQNLASLPNSRPVGQLHSQQVETFLSISPTVIDHIFHFSTLGHRQYSFEHVGLSSAYASATLTADALQSAVLPTVISTRSPTLSGFHTVDSGSTYLLSLFADCTHNLQIRHILLCSVEANTHDVYHEIRFSTNQLTYQHRHLRLSLTCPRSVNFLTRSPAIRPRIWLYNCSSSRAIVMGISVVSFGKESSLQPHTHELLVKTSSPVISAPMAFLATMIFAEGPLFSSSHVRAAGRHTPRSPC